jgi:hypothetical protein
MFGVPHDNNNNNNNNTTTTTTTGYTTGYNNILHFVH